MSFVHHLHQMLVATDALEVVAQEVHALLVAVLSHVVQHKLVLEHVLLVLSQRALLLNVVVASEPVGVDP